MEPAPTSCFGPPLGASGARRGRTNAIVFAGYLVVAFLYFGIRILPHPERTSVGGVFTDPQIFFWSFEWWPHAILHGENPFYTHAIWAPDGFNLAWATSVPGLAIAFAPVTLAFGPILSYNAACILMPALAAWTAYLLCRHITGGTWPSLVGGYLFGFSSYILGGQLSHINTVAVFLVPLSVLLVLRFLEGALSARALTLWLGALLAWQASLSTEILFTSTLAGVCALALAFVLVPTARVSLRTLVGPLIGAFGTAAVLMAPLIYYVLTGTQSRPPSGPEAFVADALNFAVPTKATVGGWWSSGLARHFPANDIERGAYLGLPTLLIIGWFGLRSRRTQHGRFLVASFCLAAVAALGSWLTVDGRRVITLPWIHLADLPLFDNIMPVRFSMFSALIAAVIVALWAASSIRPPWLRILLPGLAVVALLPNLSWHAWARSPAIPSLFTTGKYRDCLARGENVLTFPVGPRGDAMAWQAVSRFWFRMAGGYISPTIPPTFTHPAGLAHLTTADNPSEVKIGAVLELARLKSVTTIVVDARQGTMWRPILSKLGPPENVGGALIYRLPGSPWRYPLCSGS
jgi:hypothetical protein